MSQKYHLSGLITSRTPAPLELVSLWNKPAAQQLLKKSLFVGKDQKDRDQAEIKEKLSRTEFPQLSLHHIDRKHMILSIRSKQDPRQMSILINLKGQILWGWKSRATSIQDRKSESKPFQSYRNMPHVRSRMNAYWIASLFCIKRCRIIHLAETWNTGPCPALWLASVDPGSVGHPVHFSATNPSH